MLLRFEDAWLHWPLSTPRPLCRTPMRSGCEPKGVSTHWRRRRHGCSGSCRWGGAMGACGTTVENVVGVCVGQLVEACKKWAVCVAVAAFMCLCCAPCCWLPHLPPPTVLQCCSWMQVDSYALPLLFAVLGHATGGGAGPSGATEAGQHTAGGAGVLLSSAGGQSDLSGAEIQTEAG